MRVAGLVVALLALSGLVSVDAAAAVPAVQHQGFLTPAKATRTNITFGAGPANTTKPDGRSIFTYDASPGARINDHIAILNLTHHAETLRVYTVDVDAGADGGFFYPPRSAARVGAGAWVAVGTSHASGLVRAKPRSTTILPVHLKVPSNASPGDHAAAVVVSLTSLVLGGNVNGSSAQHVNLEQRVATRVLVRVSGTLRPQLSIENLRASYSSRLNPINSGSVTVKYTLRNTGNAILGGTQQVSVRGWFGTTSLASPLPAIPTLLPGGIYAVTAHVPNVFPEIRETAKVQVTPVGLAGDVNPGLSVVTATTHFSAIPGVLIAMVVALLLLVYSRIWRWRRRRRGAAESTGKPAAAPNQPTGETAKGVTA